MLYVFTAARPPRTIDGAQYGEDPPALYTLLIRYGRPSWEYVTHYANLCDGINPVPPTKRVPIDRALHMNMQRPVEREVAVLTGGLEIEPGRRLLEALIAAAARTDAALCPDPD